MSRKGLLRRSKGDCTPEALIDSLQAANEELRATLTDIQIELQQEKGKVSRLEREKVQEVKQARDLEQKKHAAVITELRGKLHEDKMKDLQGMRESLIRQHEAELLRVIKIKDSEIHRLQSAISTLRDGIADKVKLALANEARDEARRAFDGERCKLLQELESMKGGKKQAEETLSNTLQADKQKAADLRTAHHAHQEEVVRIKRESEREIRRLMDELKSRERTVMSLERELGVQAGSVQRVLLQREALDEAWERRQTGSPKRELPTPGDGAERTPDSQETHVDDRDQRRFQLRIGELHGVVRKLEDRNTLLSDERNELVKRFRETEAQLKPLLDKNRRYSKKSEDLSQTVHRLEEKIKTLSRDNLELKERLSVQAAAHAVQAAQATAASMHMTSRAPPVGEACPAESSECQALEEPSQEAQELEFLRLQVVEQQGMIDDLTKDRELDIIRWQRKQKRRSSRSSKRILAHRLVGLDRDNAMDSDSSSVASYGTDHIDRTPTTSDTELEDTMAKEESELRFRHLMHEYQALQRAYALLQEQLGGERDAERENNARELLQVDLLKYQAKVEDLEKALAEKGQDTAWVEDKQHLCKRNQELLQKLHGMENDENTLKQEIQDLQDQNELLEFRILELEERERRSPGLNLLIPPFREGHSPLQWYCARQAAMEVSIHDLMKKLDLLGDNANLRNDEQVAVIQARTVLSLADKWLHQIEGTEIALQQKMIDLENEKDMFVKQKGYLEEELDYRKQALDQAYMRVRELEATLYSTLQQKPTSIRALPGLSEKEREHLQSAVEQWKRQVLSQIREYDARILRERMESLQHAQKKIRDLEKKLERQKEQVKDLEEKFLFLFLFFSLAFIIWS
uniref:janus kinase and microtubule-interacting protein 1 n=1 Tax=Myxine glutinosa TaxID=7769 RepID=UPI00358EB2F7